MLSRKLVVRLPCRTGFLSYWTVPAVLTMGLLLGGCGEEPSGSLTPPVLPDGSADEADDGQEPQAEGDPTSAAVTGRVAEAANASRGIEGATVYLDPSDPVLQTTSSADGSFDLRGIPAGDYTLVAEGPAGSGFTRTEVEVHFIQGGSQELAVTLVTAGQAAALSSFSVSPQSVSPLPRASVPFSLTIEPDWLSHLTPTWTAQGAIGTIDSSGRLKASATEGSGRVVATLGRESATATVNVRVP